MNPSDSGSAKPITVLDFFHNARKNFKDKIALTFKDQTSGAWLSWSYEQ